MSNLLKNFLNDTFGNELEKIQKDMDTFFYDNYKDTNVPSFLVSLGSYPKVDVLEKEDHYLIVAETPGFKKEDLEVTLDSNLLTIKGKISEENKEDVNSYVLKELKKYSSFSRSFKVDFTKIDSDNLSSKYSDGILKVTLPKKNKESKKEGIKVNIE
jgi:HSP20 family protein